MLRSRDSLSEQIYWIVLSSIFDQNLPIAIAEHYLSIIRQVHGLCLGLTGRLREINRTKVDIAVISGFWK